MPAPARPDLDARIMAMLHARSDTLAKGDPLSPPIVMAAKFKLPGDPVDPHPYGRFANPTVEACEAALSALEGAPALAFPSGMAACTAAIMAATKAGDTILLPSDGYYTVRILLDEFFSAGQRKVVRLPTREFDSVDVSPFDVVWAETPSNPALETCDIASLSARTRAGGATLIVDNTTATPLLQAPLDLGADLVISSDTKALSGHSDLLFGHVATRRADLLEKVRQWRKLSGSIAGPFEAFLVQRGLMTLELRLARMCATAGTLAARLAGHAALHDLRYPGFGFILGLTLADAGRAEAFIGSCPAIFPSTSFGGVHTSAERRARWGDEVPEGYVRLSIGCEPEALLVQAIDTALAALVPPG